MTKTTIVALVEGHGEVEALPVLLRRIAAEVAPGLDLRILPFRKPRQSLIAELARYVEVAAGMIDGPGAVMILFDGDDDCPAELGPKLTKMAQLARPDLSVYLTIAQREFEAWFIASETPPFPVDPESIRGAKECLRSMRGRYSETVDQPKLCATMDLNLAMTARSFRRFHRLCVEMFEKLAKIQVHEADA